MKIGQIIIFLMGLLAGLVAAILLLNETETYEGELIGDDEGLTTAEVRLEQ